MNINDRWVIVTGCDSGIGLGVVRKLVQEHASVIAFTYTQKGANRVIKAGAKLAPCLDITDEAAMKQALRQIIDLCHGQL